MKKVYIVPQAKAIILDESELIAESNVEYGGRNNQPSGPTAAEVKETKWGEIEW